MPKIRCKLSFSPFEATRKTLEGLIAHKLEVGVLDDGLAEIAAYQEFGTSTIPARPFLHEPVSAEVDTIHDTLHTAALKGQPAEGAFQEVAYHCEAVVDRQFATEGEGRWDTRQDDSDKPLLGSLRAAVSSRISKR